MLKISIEEKLGHLICGVIAGLLGPLEPLSAPQAPSCPCARFCAYLGPFSPLRPCPYSPNVSLCFLGAAGFQHTLLNILAGSSRSEPPGEHNAYYTKLAQARKRWVSAVPGDYRGVHEYSCGWNGVALVGVYAARCGSNT